MATKRDRRFFAGLTPFLLVDLLFFFLLVTAEYDLLFSGLHSLDFSI
jgi:hypothetical protein